MHESGDQGGSELEIEDISYKFDRHQHLNQSENV